MYDFFMSIFLWIEGLSFSIFMRESSSLLAFPIFLYLHTLGMSIVAGGAAVISFALLGMWPKDASLKPLDRFYPVVYFGFWLEAVTGLAMFMKDASTYGRNPDFYWKLLCVALGVWLLAVLRKRVFKDPALDTGPVSAQARLMAGGVIACWFAAIVTGRLIAYLNPIPGFF
jgi:uncharacterized membrane protein